MAKELHLNIYGNIGEDFFYGEGVTARYVSDKLAEGSEARKIILHVNSFGGSVYEGFAIYNLLTASGKKIKAIIEGSCASMATLIALSADEIEMMPFSQWLIHNPSCFVEGDANDLEKAQQELLRIEELLINAYVSRTGKTADEIKALMDEDRFLSADEAVELGFATRMTEQLKAVAYVKPSNKTTVIMTENDKKSLFEQFKNWLNPKNEGEEQPQEQPQPEQPAATPQPEPEQALVPDEKDAEIERLKQELANAQQQAQQAQQSAQQTQTEVTNLKTELEGFKNFVPGSGDNSAAPAQTFANYDQNKQANSPFAVMEHNAKNLRNNRARKSN